MSAAHQEFRSKFETLGFGHGPYRVVGYTLKLHQNPGGYSKAGSTCDACGTAIAHCYRIRSDDGIEFQVGCDCVRKVDPELIGQCAYVRREAEVRLRREAREAQERAANGGKTNAELWAEERARRIAAAEAERDAREERKRNSTHQGVVGERTEFTLTLTGWHAYEAVFGYQKRTVRLFFYEDSAGNQFVWRSTSGVTLRNSDGSLIPLKRGQVFEVRATIKKHDIYNGVRQTILTRVAPQNTERQVAA